MSERRREEVERRFQREENPSPKMRKGGGEEGVVYTTPSINLKYK
jgi:hypothetical protein